MAGILALFKKIVIIKQSIGKYSPSTFLWIMIVFCFSCTENKSYEPPGLRKLDAQEILDRAQNNQPLFIDNIIVKDSLGNILTEDEILALDVDRFGADQFADSKGIVRELVIRKVIKEDLLLREIIIDKQFVIPPPIETFDVDCSEVRKMLNEIYLLDQQNRQGGAVSDLEIDQKNQQVVVSIIEQCGFPTAESHGSRSLQAIFLVIQHADKSLRIKYFPEFKQLASNGKFSKSTLALMEDRMRMDNGQKQIYGSQVHKENGASEWEIYPVEDPACLNERRAKVGLGPIEEYLANFGIDYQRNN